MYALVKRGIPKPIMKIARRILGRERVFRKQIDHALMSRYVAKCLNQDSVIFELGPATGASAKLFAEFACLSPSNYYLIEACPVNCEVIKKEMPEFHVLNYAVASSPGEITFYIIDDPAEPGSSRSNCADRVVLERKFPKARINEIQVPSIDVNSLFNICETNFCDYLYMNIEGGEYLVFQGDLSFLDKVRFFSIDLHHGLFGADTTHQLMVQTKQRIYDEIVSRGFVRVGGFKREDIAAADHHMTFLFEKGARQYP